MSVGVCHRTVHTDFENDQYRERTDGDKRLPRLKFISNSVMASRMSAAHSTRIYVGVPELLEQLRFTDQIVMIGNT